jgi:hypothetical protein
MKRIFFQDLKFFFKVVAAFLINIVASKIPLNYIWGTFAGMLTVQQGTFPALLARSPFKAILISGFMDWICGRSFSLKILIKYLPSLCAGIFFYLRTNWLSGKNLYCAQLILLTLLLLFFITGFAAQVPYLYTSMWFVLLIPFNKLNLWGKSFQSVALAHGIGTVIHQYGLHSLTYENYMALFFIALSERIILASVFWISFKIYSILEIGISPCSKSPVSFSVNNIND